MGCDLDDVCAYKTEVKVRVRHKTIGFIYYVAMLAIVIFYIGLYEIWYLSGYGEVQELSGSLRASVMLNRDITPVENLPYCSQAAIPKGATAPQVRLPCMSRDEMVTKKETPPLSLIIGTRLSTKYEIRNAACGDLDYGCERWSTTSEEAAFIGDVDNATVLVQHAVAPASVLAIGREAIDTFHNRSDPRLFGAGGERYAIACTGYHVARNGEPEPRCPTSGDLFFVRDLLAVGEVDLDEAVEDEHDEVTSRRESGLTMRINLVYSGASSYAYRVSANKIETKVESADWLNETSRMTLDLHGVNLLFAQTGGVLLFEWRTLILTFVSGITLLSMAKSLADTFLLYIAPRKDDYALFVEHITPDFGPDTDAERLVLAKVLARKRKERAELLGHVDDRGELLANAGPMPVNMPMATPIVAVHPVRAAYEGAV